MPDKKLENILRRVKQRLNEDQTLNTPPNTTNKFGVDKILSDIKENNHSLANHPIFDNSIGVSIEEQLFNDRFEEITNNYKRFYDTQEVDEHSVMMDSMSLLGSVMSIEADNIEKLEGLAIQLIYDEFDIPEDVIDFQVKLSKNIDTSGLVSDPKSDIIGFESYEEAESIKKEVEKRRLVNAIIQGAAMKTNHMYFMVNEELGKIDPTLPTKYSKLMSAADYTYFLVDRMDQGIKGGVSKVILPKDENTKPKIIAEAITFPVLIHELVKGVMEFLGSHGLPEDNKICKEVIEQADYTAAESWDMRLGPAIWGKLTNLIPSEDFHLKHELFYDIVTLPVDEFNSLMREVVLNTKKAQTEILDILNNIKKIKSEEAFDNAINEKRGKYYDDNYSDDPNDLAF